MKYRCWYLGHAWDRWEGEIRKLGHFHHDYIDHFVYRWRYCERCGKKQNESYFVPGISESRHPYREVLNKLREVTAALHFVANNAGEPPFFSPSAVAHLANSFLSDIDKRHGGDTRDA